MIGIAATAFKKSRPVREKEKSLGQKEASLLRTAQIRNLRGQKKRKKCRGQIHRPFNIKSYEV